MKISHSTVLEIRRINYHLKKRDLTEQEEEKRGGFIAEYKMGWKDQMGYDFELKEVLPRLEENGLGEHLTYHNPIDPYEWAHTKTVGVDLILEVGKFIFYVEVSFCSRNYPYRRKWFEKCRIPRFDNCPKPSEYVYWIVLTNRPENFNSVKNLAKEFSIRIMSIDNLISLLTNLTISNTVNN